MATGGLKQPGETVTFYQQETERGSEWSLIPLSVFVSVVIPRENSKMLSGAKYSSTRPSSEAQKQHFCRYGSETVSGRLYIELRGDILEP